MDKKSSILSRHHILVCGLLLLVAFAFALRQLYSPDIGFHLKAGVWMLEHREILQQDVFSYTVAGKEYINLYWLYQIFVALLYRCGGVCTIVLINALLVTASVFLMLVRLNARISLENFPPWPLLTLLALTAIAPLFEVRPHIVSWLFLSAELFVLEEYDRGRENMLWWFLPLQILWTNMHPLAILGVVVFGCYFCAEVLRNKTIRTRTLLVFVLVLLALFATPFLWKGAFLPFQQLGMLLPDSAFKHSIGEYRSPFIFDNYRINGRFTLFQPLFPFHLLFFGSIIWIVVTFRRRGLYELLLFGCFLFVAFLSIKNIGYFVVAVFPLLPTGRCSAGENGFKIRTGKIFRIVSIFLAVFLLWSVVTNRYYISVRSNIRFGCTENSLSLPTGLAKFLQHYNLKGRILNDFNFGGYLIFASDFLVTIDGRNELYGHEFYTTFSTYWNHPQKKYILQKFQPDAIAFSHLSMPDWVEYLKNDPQWQLVYFDYLSALYLRQDYAPEVPTLGREALRLFPRITDAKSIDSLLQKPAPSFSVQSLFTMPYFPQREIGVSTFCFYNDWKEEAYAIGLLALQRATVPVPEAYFNLGNFFFEWGDFEWAAYCYQRCLETNTIPLAQERLQRIKSMQGRE